MGGHEAARSTEGPIVVTDGGSPAGASRPDGVLQTDRYLHYESHPIPWWVAIVWVGFFIFGIWYLATNLGT
jgi:hypothetical protein